MEIDVKAAVSDMEKVSLFLIAALCVNVVTAATVAPEKFRSPPPEARPHTWWHWMNGNVTKEGITADLEAMARVGIGGVQIFDAGLALPKGPVEFASDAWFDCLVHADREAKRLGIELCVANCSGWTSSAGPWITPELSMKYVTNTTVRVKGGERFDGVLPMPEKTNGFYEDIALLAFPTPASSGALHGLPDFDLQVFRGRGNFHLGAAEGGPQMPVRITDKIASAEACIASPDIIDLTAHCSQSGNELRLAWDAPPSHKAWTVLRIGYMANGRTNRSASKAGLGLECDKLDPHALDVHFDAYVGRLLKKLPKDHALNGVLLDSYEVYGQNWTRGFDRCFAEATGYSITNFLPVLAGYPVDGAERTETFLRDFRRVISTMFCRNYSGRLRERCNENGLLLYCEPYGNGPFNDLEFARECDVPMSEFWRPRDVDCDLAALERQKNRTYMECRWGNKALGNSKTVAATAHVWGRRIVGAEAFTSYPDSGSGRWLESPFAMKLQCDRIFSEGVNRMIFHRYVHQPWTNPTRYPGMTMAAYGAHLERTQTWWNHGAKEFFTYMARTQYMLQLGSPVGDVLLCTSGEAPDYGTDGVIPEGYAGDRCHPVAFAQCKKEGDWVVSPGGTRYRVAVRFGEDAASVLKSKGIKPDFICNDHDVTWTHRIIENEGPVSDKLTDVYFVAVPNKEQKKVKCSFRDGRGRPPELWNPVSGEIALSSDFSITADGRTELTLDCNPSHSVFVLFRSPIGDRPHCHDGDRPQSGDRPCQQMGSVPISGPWRVTFREPGATSNIAETTYASLASWTENENPEIRYFSGTATYYAKFSLAQLGSVPKKLGSVPKKVVLDLGHVCDIAEVEINGHAYPALWCPPYRLNITDTMGTGPQTVGTDPNFWGTDPESREVDIKIKVTNRWPNRLIGDARLPDDCEWDDGSRSKGYPLVKAYPDWLISGLPSPTGRHAFSTCRLWTGDEPLQTAGLLGPVTIRLEDH